MSMGEKRLKICFVSSSRSDFGLLKELMKNINEDSFFDFHLVVTGSHLSKYYGNTINEIVDEGFSFYETIETLQSSDTQTSIATTSAITLIKFTDHFKRVKPDLIVVLGDRYEILSVCFAASFCKIPIAHLHGGEITQAALDNNFRHCITKLSHLHFVSHSEYLNRVVQLGEDQNLFITLVV